MTALDKDFAPMGRAAFAEASRILLSLILDDGLRYEFFSPTRGWRHHGLGCLQQEITPTLRVHVWAPELCVFADDPHRSVHDHRFDLTSFVAAGEIVDTSFRIEPARFLLDKWYAQGDFGKSFDRNEANETNVWRVKHAKVQDGDDVSLIGPAVATELEHRTLSAGAVYGIERGQFHSTRVDKPVAVTVVSRSNFGQERARILGRNIAWGGIVRDRNEDLYAEVLGRARFALHLESKSSWFQPEG